MNLEIEAKISVPSLDAVSRRLQQLGAEPVDTVSQTDTYLTDTENRLPPKGCGLRLRRQSGKSGQIAWITFKGPRTDSRYKSRPEAETQVADYDTALNIFLGLGYTPRITVEKNRQLWKLESCLVCLDQLPKLGCFVEVEGPDEQQVQQVLTKLGLSDQPHISASYAKLTAQANQNR